MKRHDRVEVDALPKCDFCSAEAHVDGRTVAGPWAYMCVIDSVLHGVGLGLGSGQRLVLRRQVRH